MNITPTEDEEQASLFRWAEWAKSAVPELALLYAIPNGGYRHKATAAKMKTTGTKSGVPDIFLPVARHGCHGLYIEMKRTQGGTVSKAQAEWMEQLMRQGYRCCVCCGWIAAKEEIERYLDGG